MNILVLCTGNSARSILLEALLGADSRITSFSAGSNPAGAVHPQSLKLLSSLNYDVSNFRSKSWDEFTGEIKMDAVITVCSNAANEVCPIWPGAPITAHWGVDDPAAAAKSNWEPAFSLAHERLKKSADALLALPFEGFDAAELKDHLDQIGKI
ncbi:MAG: arsenate reductase ArsC [Paracoccaceae bacterium]|nr:arsenate reductase ArsC [Paracoccaceae bacterium]